MYKSCQPENMAYGNSHKAKQPMICGTPGLYRSLCQGKDVKTFHWYIPVAYPL